VSFNLILAAFGRLPSRLRSGCLRAGRSWSDAADALIDAGADLEMPGGSIGTTLDNAIGYGCWRVARRLVERGARIDKLLASRRPGPPIPGPGFRRGNPGTWPQEINKAFWQACHGGQRRTAEYLLRNDADIHTTVAYAHGTALDVAAGTDTRRDLLASWLREHHARPGSAAQRSAAGEECPHNVAYGNRSVTGSVNEHQS
jgi:hypothetical protein